MHEFRIDQTIDTPFDSKPRATQETHLHRNPDWSDVEAWVKASSPILDEEAARTLAEISNSVMKFYEPVCEKLLEIWKLRRANPSLVLHPKGQWTLSGERSTFAGYSKAQAEFAQPTTSPKLIKENAGCFRLSGELQNILEWIAVAQRCSLTPEDHEM